jgi:hypothetical protein
MSDKGKAPSTIVNITVEVDSCSIYGLEYDGTPYQMARAVGRLDKRIRMAHGLARPVIWVVKPPKWISGRFSADHTRGIRPYEEVVLVEFLAPDSENKQASIIAAYMNPGGLNSRVDGTVDAHNAILFATIVRELRLHQEER